MPKNDTKPLQDFLAKHSIKDWGSHSKTFQFKVPLLGYKGISKDALTNSFWEVDASEWHEDVMPQWEKGNLILNHKIHSSVAIIMSKDMFEKYLLHPSTVVFSNFMDYLNLEREIEETYFKRSETVEASGILAPGYIYATGVADGCAHYLITKVTKASVFLEHLHFGDGYRDPHIDAYEGKMPLAYFNKISFFGRAFRIPTLKSPFAS
jgi:hypothetical protein